MILAVTTLQGIFWVMMIVSVTVNGVSMPIEGEQPAHYGTQDECDAAVDDVVVDLLLPNLKKGDVIEGQWHCERRGR